MKTFSFLRQGEEVYIPLPSEPFPKVEPTRAVAIRVIEDSRISIESDGAGGFLVYANGHFTARELQDLALAVFGAPLAAAVAGGGGTPDGAGTATVTAVEPGSGQFAGAATPCAVSGPGSDEP